MFQNNFLFSITRKQFFFSTFCFQPWKNNFFKRYCFQPQVVIFFQPLIYSQPLGLRFATNFCYQPLENSFSCKTFFFFPPLWWEKNRWVTDFSTKFLLSTTGKQFVLIKTNHLKPAETRDMWLRACSSYLLYRSQLSK